ncbi:hypothetical protein TcWFU_000108 [Taenia crassiceps]|uniref:Uncharacterized protein n=1 Tax=Taenia crassiceps TaxID=6207 RepID=A0ABR4QBU6_9CEST
MCSSPYATDSVDRPFYGGILWLGQVNATFCKNIIKATWREDLMEGISHQGTMTYPLLRVAADGKTLYHLQLYTVNFGRV